MLSGLTGGSLVHPPPLSRQRRSVVVAPAKCRLDPEAGAGYHMSRAEPLGVEPPILADLTEPAYCQLWAS